MKYINPVPSVDDVEVGKALYINPLFTFDHDVTTEEAAAGISDLIAENGGQIPADWLRFTGPTRMYRK